jgi:hypothetical protein
LGEIDFYAPKLRRHAGAEARFLGQTVRIKREKVAEYCQGRAGYHFETAWNSRGIRGEFCALK